MTRTEPKAKGAKERRENNARGYSFGIVSYASIEELQPLLKTAKHYAYILHDKDEGRDAHYHIYATFHTAKSFKGVCGLVESEENTFAELLKGSADDLLTYFTHSNELEKYQYDASEIVYDNDSKYWSRGADKEAKEQENEQFLADLLSAKSLREMAIKYGRDFMKNYQSYALFREAVRAEEMRNLEKQLDGQIASVNHCGEPVTWHMEVTEAERGLIAFKREKELSATLRQDYTDERKRKDAITTTEKLSLLSEVAKNEET